MKKEKVRFILLQFFVWTLYLVYNIQVIHADIQNNLPIKYVYLILLCYFGIPLTLLLRKLYVKINLSTFSLGKLFLTIFLGVVLTSHLWFFEIILLDQLLVKNGYGVTTYNLHYYFWEIFTASLLLLAWSGIYFITKFWFEWKAQKEKTHQAQLLAQDAQLKVLEYQFNPHFLFNSLSSLRALIHIDTQKADMMLSHISEFLKYPLLNKNRQEVPLVEEIEVVQNYLKIEKIRFENNLMIHLLIDPLAEDYPVPVFLLQPLIENSVKFGMETSEKPLEIKITADVNGEELILIIENSGSWVKQKNDRNGTGTGLDNVKKRLQYFYPRRHSFQIIKSDHSVIVKIILLKELLPNGNQ